MADLRNAIREMLRRGMAEAEIKENLSEMGVADADAVFRQATEMLSTMPLSPAPQQPRQSREQSREPGVMQAQPVMQAETQLKPVASSNPAPASPSDNGDAIALLNSLIELNKKILETNRAILLRLKP